MCGQVTAGSVAAAIAAYVSVRFLSRCFTRRTLTPFAVYSFLIGVLALLRFGLYSARPLVLRYGVIASA